MKFAIVPLFTALTITAHAETQVPIDQVVSATHSTSSGRLIEVFEGQGRDCFVSYAWINLANGETIHLEGCPTRTWIANFVCDLHSPIEANDRDRISIVCIAK